VNAVVRGRSNTHSTWLRDMIPRVEIGKRGSGIMNKPGQPAVDAVDAHFCIRGNFAQLIKLYSSPDITGPDWFVANSHYRNYVKCPTRTAR
jgi:hypothetical protein